MFAAFGRCVWGIVDDYLLLPSWPNYNLPSHQCDQRFEKDQAKWQSLIHSLSLRPLSWAPVVSMGLDSRGTRLLLVLAARPRRWKAFLWKKNGGTNLTLSRQMKQSTLQCSICPKFRLSPGRWGIGAVLFSG